MREVVTFSETFGASWLWTKTDDCVVVDLVQAKIVDLLSLKRMSPSQSMLAALLTLVRPS